MQNKVLIIEDNLDLQEIYKLEFEAEDFSVKTSDDGLKWIIEILANRPDVIILDIMMPDMDGFEVLTTIRDQSSIRIPIIVCSNLSNEDDEKKALSLWADLYMRKSDYEAEEIVREATKLVDSIEK